MKREEPSACLVHALVDKVGGEELRRNGVALVCAVDKRLTVGLGAACHLALKRVVELGIRHGARIEPHVDKVALTIHGLALVVDKNNIVDIRTVEVYAVIILLGEIARHKALVLHRVALHHAGSNSLLDLGIKLLKRAYALLTTVLVAPDGQRGAPEA